MPRTPLGLAVRRASGTPRPLGSAISTAPASASGVTGFGPERGPHSRTAMRRRPAGRYRTPRRFELDLKDKSVSGRDLTTGDGDWTGSGSNDRELPSARSGPMAARAGRPHQSRHALNRARSRGRYSRTRPPKTSTAQLNRSFVVRTNPRIGTPEPRTGGHGPRQQQALHQEILDGSRRWSVEGYMNPTLPYNSTRLCTDKVGDRHPRPEASMSSHARLVIAGGG